MIIQQTQVSMASTRSYQRTEAHVSQVDTEVIDTGLATTKNDYVRTDFIERGQKSRQKVRDQIIQYLLERLIGKGLGSSSLADYLEELQSGCKSSDTGYTLGIESTSISRTYSLEEREAVSFDTTGCVQTADGRTISFNLHVGLSRSFAEVSSTKIDYSQPVLIDPLVIHTGADLSSLSDQSFFFDLDCDGVSEELQGLGQGSGFLALDRDENGTIDDGSELFGASTGDGFKELADYDEDGNGWIDEADSIFSKLKIWYQSGDKEASLVTLSDAGVGAIYLGSSSADYSLTDSNNQTNAVIRKHGIFLYEEGSVGSIQQVDLAVKHEYSA